MTSTTVLSRPVLPARAPSWVSRNAKFLWAGAGLLLTVLTDVANLNAGVIPLAWLPVLHGVILVLIAAGVQRDTNAMGVEQVVQLVQHVLPGHKLVALPAPSTVLDAPPVTGSGVVALPQQPAGAEAPHTVVVTMPATAAPAPASAQPPASLPAPVAPTT